MAYFTLQQNKFMKTTNQEAGMSDAQHDGMSIMKMAIDTATCCVCCSCCRKQIDTREPSQSNSEQSRQTNTDQSALVLPNQNTDLWIKFLLKNLNEIRDLPWVPAVS